MEHRGDDCHLPESQHGHPGPRPPHRVVLRGDGRRHLPPRMSFASRDVRRLVQLAPAILVTITALFALPQQAGGFRLAKWSAFGLGLGAIGAALLAQSPPLRLPRSWFALGAFVA